MYLPFSVSVIAALEYLVRFINLLILVRVVFSWINPNPSNALVQFVYSVTEPILSPIRNLIFNKLGYNGMIDFTPIAAIFLVNFLFYRVIVGIFLRFIL